MMKMKLLPGVAALLMLLAGAALAGVLSNILRRVCGISLVQHKMSVRG
jgi:hypothetical protein